MATYKSNISNLGLTIRPKQDMAINTVDGVKIIKDNGLHINFVNGMFTTEDKEIIEAIEKLKCFNKKYQDVIITRIDTIGKSTVKEEK